MSVAGCGSGSGNAKFDQNVSNSVRVVIPRDKHKLIAVSLQRIQIDTLRAHRGEEAAVRHTPTPTPDSVDVITSKVLRALPIGRNDPLQSVNQSISRLITTGTVHCNATK